MGNYNCSKCVDRDKNELLINKRIISNENIQWNLHKTIEKKIKINNKNKNNKENENSIMNNIETNLSLDKNNLPKKSKSTINDKFFNLRKEERDNNILLKNELNKIKNFEIDISYNDLNINNEKKERKEIKEQNINKNINNKNNEYKETNIINKNNFINNQNNNNQIIDKNKIRTRPKANSQKNSIEQQKLIELQKKQIEEQQKIIDQYKKKQLLYEQQQLQLQQAQLKIKEQQNQLESKNIKPKIIKIKSYKNNSNKKIQNKRLSASRSTPKPKINLFTPISNKKKLEQQNSEIFIKNIPDKKNEIKELNEISEEEKQLEYSQNIQQQQINQVYEEQKNQIQEMENYERFEEEDNEEEEIDLALHSQKFKIETYEPIEQDSKNDNNDNIYNNENLFEKNNIKLEPRDTPRINLRNLINSKQNNNINNNNSKGILSEQKIKKKEFGPSDSGKKIVNNNKQDISEEQKNINKKILSKMMVRGSEPTDSKKNNILKNMDNDLNEYKYYKYKQYKQFNHSQEGKQAFDINEQKDYINNQNFQNDNNEQYIKRNYNPEKKEIFSLVNSSQEQINPNIYQSEIFLKPEMNQNLQQSIKKNEIIYPELYNEQNDKIDITNIIQKYKNNATLGEGIYIDGLEGINIHKSIGPIISNYKPQENQNLMNINSDIYGMKDIEGDIPPFYNNRENENYLEEKYAIYQNQINQNNFQNY